MGKKRKLVSENGRGTSPWSELNEKSNISKPKEGKISYFSIQRIQNIIDERRKNIMIYYFPDYSYLRLFLKFQ